MHKLFKIGVPFMLVTLVASGCSFGSKEAMKEMDPPQINYIEEGESLDLETETEETQVQDQEEVVTETVKRELYLLDANGMVVPQTFELPKTEGVIRQSLEYLVDGGPISNMLPSGFQAVLPAGTEIDVNLTPEGIAIADFSEEFKNYQPEQELKILQAITWTLTQFENVETVKVRINGYDQETMPVNQTPIGKGVSRADGINIESDEVVDIVNSKGVTLYFLSEHDGNTYYVPVTRRVAENADPVATVVNELLDGPSYQSLLLTDFSKDVELLGAPVYENGIVTLNFNEAVLNHLQGTAISEDVLNLLVLSLTEQEGVEKVSIQVNGDEKVLRASGEFMAEPVSRPSLVNAGKF